MKMPFGRFFQGVGLTAAGRGGGLAGFAPALAVLPREGEAPKAPASTGYANPFGLYDISRRRSRGESVALGPTLAAWRDNAPSIGFYALMLTLSLAAWIRMSLAVVGLFYPAGAPSLGTLLSKLGSSPEGVTFVLAYLAAGSLLALFVFATSAVALPMLLDRSRMDTISAMITSFKALRTNPRPMLTWGAMIVVLMVAGFATSCIGLVLAVPVVGHMAWHAYRDLVEPETPGA